MTHDSSPPTPDGDQLKPDVERPRPSVDRQRPRREGWRAALVWALGLVAIVGLTVLAVWAGVVLAVLGLAGVVLVLGVALLAVVSVWARRLMLPGATLALALMLPAAAVQHIETRIDPSAGALIVAPRTPAEVSSSSYTRGFGPVLIDLRRFSAEPGTTTAIRGRSDDDHVVVALPRDRCFNLEVHYSVGDRYQSESRELVEQLASIVAGRTSQDGGIAFTSQGLTEAAEQRDRELVADSHDPKIPSPDPRYARERLLLFGRYPWTTGTAVRKVEGDAPNLRLDLRAGQQIVVRDYPDWAGPLDNQWNGVSDQVAGMGWPNTARAPLSPGERGWRTRAAVHTKANRARWVKWEREIVPWAHQQVKRLAGPCATQEELRQRAYRFYIQPEAFKDDGGRVQRLLGGPTTRHSAIRQPVASNPRLVFAVEVDGLGQVRVVDQVQPSAILATPTFSAVPR